MNEDNVRNMENLMLGKQNLTNQTKPCKACTSFQSWTKKLTNDASNTPHDTSVSILKILSSFIKSEYQLRFSTLVFL